MDHCIDRRQITRLQQGPVKDNGGHRRAFHPVGSNRRQIGCIHAGPVDSGPQQRTRWRRGLGPVDDVARSVKEAERIVRPASVKISSKRAACVGIKSRKIVQLRVGTGVARKEGHRNPAGLCLGAKLLHAIGPVGAAAEEPDDNKPRAGNRVGDVLVDRERMAEAEVIGNPDFRHIPFCLPAGHRGRQEADLGISRCQDDDIARRLAEIDCLVGIVEGAALLDPKKMHVRRSARRRVGRR